MPVALPWKVVWITGASSGIGRELALSLARDGATVAVSARSKDKLAELAKLAGGIRAYPLDVTDPEAAARVAAAIERDLGPIELAVLNAGVWEPMTASRYDGAKARSSIAVNYVGVVNVLDPLMKSMIERQNGQIAIVASVAGYRGLPKGAAYGPTKAALINLAESLYPDLKLKGVKMTLICPGFVATPMTDVNTFPMPFIIPVDEAVHEIRRGLTRPSFEIVFPSRMKRMMKVLRLLPYAIYFWATGKISKRETAPTAAADE
jgi:short-subunit dehydrogenase